MSGTASLLHKNGTEKTPASVDEKEALYSLRVTFKRASGEPITLTAVYQDTLPTGSAIGTVITMHGSIGSHNDFKYVAPLLTAAGIRVIGINFPGFGLSEDARGLQFDNVERNNFVQALITALGINSNIVFMGHSRGTENALRLTLLNKTTSAGVVLVNPMGLRGHRGVRPMFQFAVYSWLYDYLPWARPLWHRLFAWMLNFVGLKVANGRIAAVSMKTVAATELEKQRPVMEKLMKPEYTQRVLFAYSGKDPMIERPVYEEFVVLLKDRVHLECKTKDAEDEEKIMTEMKQAFGEGHKAVSAFFTTNNHFLQKHRAQFLAQGVMAMLEADKKKLEERRAKF